MTTVDYDEMSDDFYYRCHLTGCTSPTGEGHMVRRDATVDAEFHAQLHDDGVI